MNFIVCCLTTSIVITLVSAVFKSFIKPLVKVKSELAALVYHVLIGALVGLVIFIILDIDIDSNPVGCGIVGGTSIGIAERLFICEKKTEEYGEARENV